MEDIEIDYRWGCRNGEELYHVILIKFDMNVIETKGTPICGASDIKVDNGDTIDYSAHPRIGKRCEECYSKLLNDMWIRSVE